VGCVYHNASKAKRKRKRGERDEEMKGLAAATSSAIQVGRETKIRGEGGMRGKRAGARITMSRGTLGGRAVTGISTGRPGIHLKISREPNTQDCALGP